MRKKIMKGEIYEVGSTGVQVALVEPHGRDAWRGLVVASSHPSYPVGGFDIVVFSENLGRRVVTAPMNGEFEFDLPREEG